jgi:hypothetical protein
MFGKTYARDRIGKRLFESWAAPANHTSATTFVIKNFMFSPMSMSVSPGAVVTVRQYMTGTLVVG